MQWYQIGALATCAATFAYVILRRRRRLHTVRDIPGPVNPSWIFGKSPRGSTSFLIPSCSGLTVLENLQGYQWYFMTEEVGGVENRFLENFGNIVRWNGPFGVRLVCRRTHASVLCSESLLTRLVHACRRIACGSQTRRPSTTSFRKPAICMASRATFGNGPRCSPIVVSYGQKVSCQ